MRSSMVLSKSGKPLRTLAASCLASSTRSGAKSSAAAWRSPVWFQSSACSRRTRALFSSTDMLLLFVSAYRTLAGQTLPTDEYDASYRSTAHALSTGELRRLYEKGWRASQVQVLMAKNSEKSISLCSLVGLWSLLLGLIRTFHTVSLGTSVNKSRFGHADSSPIHRHPLPCGQ